MDIAVLGGDKRQIYLSRLFEEDGHRVHRFAMGEKAVLPDKVHMAVLPLPSFKDGMLNAPLSQEKYSKDQVMAMLSGAGRVFGGMVQDETMTDYNKCESFTIKNAYITAKCAVMMLQQILERPLSGVKILVSGYGRIGKFLTQELIKEGCAVTVTARKERDLAMAGCAGAEARLCSDMKDAVRGVDIVANTAPSLVIGQGEIDCCKKDCLFMELASAPYGIDMKYAEKTGRKVCMASGLPGKMMPMAAAEAIRDAIYYLWEG